MDPKRALLFAAALQLTGGLLGGTAVIYTIQNLLYIEPGHLLLEVLLSGLVGATVWNILTWKIGMPSSSTHALVGGLLGAACIAAGPMSVAWGFNLLAGPAHHLSGIAKVLVALLVSPPIGFGLAFMFQKMNHLALRNSDRKVERWLNRTQWATAGFLAFSHGANDTQKHVGIILLALLSASMVQPGEIPIWLKILVGVIMICGTMTGGWSIMRTLGFKIYHLHPIHSLNSQLASATSGLVATVFGGPISTTHVVGSSVLGAGAGDRVRMVSWRVGQEMMLSWFITIPASAVVGVMMFPLVDLILNML